MFDDKPNPPRNFANPGNGCEAALPDEIVPPLQSPKNLNRLQNRFKSLQNQKLLFSLSLLQVRAWPVRRSSGANHGGQWTSISVHNYSKNLIPESQKNIDSIQGNKDKLLTSSKTAQ
jgi:hypothetical protein